MRCGRCEVMASTRSWSAGIEALDQAAQRLPEGVELVDRRRVAVRAAASGCTSGRRTARRTRHRGPNSRCRPPGGRARNARPAGRCGSHVADHRLLHRADVGDDAAGLEAGRDRLRAAAPQAPTGVQTITRSASSHGRRGSVPQWSTSSAGRRRRAVSALRVRGDDLAGEAAAPRGERERAADQADADQRDLSNIGALAALPAATKRPSAVAHGLDLALGADGDAQARAGRRPRSCAGSARRSQPALAAAARSLRPKPTSRKLPTLGQRPAGRGPSSRAEPGQPDIVVARGWRRCGRCPRAPPRRRPGPAG